MEKVTLQGKFNNKGLKKLHPKSHISNKKIIIKDEPNIEFINSLVYNTESSIKSDYQNFKVCDFRLEGRPNEWKFEIDIFVW